jgi:hypothetical protein
MTPQEQQMVADLFDRLASLEGERRDPDAARTIRDGLARAPNAAYALVQTALVQDEALKRANARIEELEKAVRPEPAPTGGGFLDSMRNVFTAQSRGGSVPSVRPGGQGSSGAWNAPPPPPPGYAPQPGYPPPPPGYMQGPPMGGGMTGGGGGSFLGTAAATAAGVIGGGLLLNGIRSAFAGGGHQAFGGSEAFGPSPWGSDRGGGELSRDAGVGDIGSRHGGAWNDQARADALQDRQQDLDDDQDEQQDYEEDYADNSGDFDDGDTA